MRECVLLFQFEQTKQRKLVAQLLPARFKVKVVGAEELDFPIGYLTGNKELPVREEKGKEGQSASEEPQGHEQAGETAPQPLEGEMLVMAGVSGDRLNTVLQAVKKAGIGTIPYKAVVTETNQAWTARELFEELRKEHEAMKTQNNDGKMLHEQK
ncbi:MAG: DUF3783 domain-containing protein [Lachnospiraceae bacterium]|nr:DUF3783 domain-containing protein [Lachnospiraceae bacterium]